NGSSEKREVRQFQSTAWPDHGVPEHPTPFLAFLRRVKACNPPDAGPMVRIKHEKTADIYGHVTLMRSQRNYMVQTEDQYVFIHDALQEAVNCGATEDGQSRTVRQFQFTDWPEQGVPKSGEGFIDFIGQVHKTKEQFGQDGPISVHCSAGVGRTGCFIVIDAMLERIKHEKTADIYGHVTLMRSQRNYMVQTEDQYVFIHDALQEAVNCGATEVPARNLYAYIQKLTQIEGGENITGMELEFKRLANTKAHTSRFISANLPCNKFKNRLVNIMPYESTRVCLQPIRGVEGSDYINASFIDGYRQQKAYIATQGPLAETTEDFWRMLWEHNSTIVVMLTKLREMGREKCHQYWPAERSARYQYFVVDPMAEYNMPHAGVGRTGVFITLSIVLERMRYEGVVDIFQTVKMLRTQRPAMVQTEDQYQFCYRAGLEYLGSFDHYATEEREPATEQKAPPPPFLSPVLAGRRDGQSRTVRQFQFTDWPEQGVPKSGEGFIDFIGQDQYQFCYRAGLEYLGSFDHYAT
ncbi:hypothetical protein CRUP_019556, partial [Coryphaenoides rupestris]